MTRNAGWMSGSILRRRRTRMGLTAAQMGARLKVRESTVLRWETGASSPTPRHLALIAELLEVDPGDLMPHLSRRRPSLRDLRVLAALDLTAAAERSGLSRNVIVRLERGVTAVGNRAEPLAAAYGVDIELIEEAAECTRTESSGKPQELK